MSIRGFNIKGSLLSRAISEAGNVIRANCKGLVHKYLGGTDNTGPLTRNIISTNGVDQYATFANTIVGDGVGEIVLTAKVSNPGVNFKILDGVDGTNTRLYINSSSGGYNVTPSINITVDYDGNADSATTAVFGEVATITLAGDLTGLKLRTLLAHFTEASDFAVVQLLSFTYKDQSQEFSLSFDNGLGYEVIGEPGRDLVTQNKTTTWDGTEAAWTSVALGANVEAGKSYLITETLSEGSTGLVKAQVGSEGGEWPPMTAISRVYISTPDASYAQQVQTNGTFIGTVTVEIREVPNALIWQNYTSDQWATYVQQPNGDWKGKDNLFGPETVHETWDVSGTTYTKNANEWGVLGESADTGAIQGAQDIMVSYNLLGSNMQLATRNAEDTSNVLFPLESGYNEIDVAIATRGLWFTDYTSMGESLSGIKFNSLIKLSDYQRNQFYIEQAEAAIAGYKAKDTKPYLVDADGVDDTVILGSPLVFPGPFDISFVLTRNNRSSTEQTNLLGNSVDSNHRLALNDSDHASSPDTVFLIIGGVIRQFSAGAASLELGSRGIVRIVRDLANVPSLYIDNIYIASGAAVAGDFIVDTLFSGNNTQMAIGVARDFVMLDHTAPLPLGQGGNSGYWPMNKAGDTVDNVLGLDSKGNVVAKDGAELGAELAAFGTTVIIPASTPTNTVVAGSNTYLDVKWLGVPLEVVVTTDSPENIAFDVGNTGYIAAASNPRTILKVLDSQRLRVKLSTSALSSDATVNISVKPAYGYAQWQGAPEGDQYTYDKVSGALANAGWPNLLVHSADYTQPDWIVYGSLVATPSAELTPEGDSTFVVDCTGGTGMLRQYIDSQHTSRYAIAYVKGVAGETIKLETRAADNSVINQVTHTFSGDWEYINNFQVEVDWTLQTDASVGVSIRDDAVNTATTFLLANMQAQDAADLSNGVNVTGAIAGKQLLLSDELQRQHDLAIVEAKFAKWDKAFSKNVALREFDGVDDGITVPADAITLAGDCDITFTLAAGLQTDAGLIGDALFVTTGYEGNVLLYVDDPNGLDFLIGGDGVDFERLNLLPQSDVLSGSIDTLTISKRGDKLSAKMGSGATGTTNTIINNVPLILGEAFVATPGRRTLGQAGPMSVLDYADPYNSRYYIQTPWGMQDLMATVGDEMWLLGALVLNGDSAAWDFLTQDSAPLKQNTLYLATISWANLTGKLRLLVGNSTHVTTSTETGTTSSITLLLDTGTSTRLVIQDLDGGATADSVTATVKEMPNAGLLQGAPADPVTLTKVGDDWYGPELWNGVTDLPRNVPTVVASGLSSSGTYELIVEGLSGGDTKASLDGWPSITPAMTITGVSGTLWLADWAASQSGLTISIKQVIKGA